MRRRVFLRELGFGAICWGTVGAGCRGRTALVTNSAAPATPTPTPSPAPKPVKPEEPERVLGEDRSEYNHVIVKQSGSIRTMYFEVDGELLTEATIDLNRPTSIHLDVFQTMMAAFLLQPNIRKMMMIGLGGGQVTNYLYHRFPRLEIDVVDICPAVVRMAKEYFQVPDDPRYRIHVADGRMFVEQAPKDAGWDLIVLDAFRGVSVPLPLRTRQFYEACLTRLSKRGVLVANMHKNSGRYPDDRSTLASVFPHTYRFVSEGGWQTAVVATRQKEVVSREALSANARKLADRFDGFDLPALAGRHQTEKDWVSDIVLDDDFKPNELEAGVRRHNDSCGLWCADDPEPD